MSFTDVTGQWIQPKVMCSPGTPSSVAIWVGLGGYSSSSKELEQIGTSADCSESGKASYYVWYELLPADSVTVMSLKINPGDAITSVVKVNRKDVLVQVHDRTRDTWFTKHLSMPKLDLTSAEWIAEAPLQCGSSGICRQEALANFGSIDFTQSFATGNGVGATISSPSWTSTGVRLVPKTSGRVLGDRNASHMHSLAAAGANPSLLNDDGDGFSIAWQANPMLAAATG
jgi:hypothetical protein